MLSAGIAALAHRKNEIACQDAKQIPQQIATYGPQNGSKIGPSKWVPCNQLIHLLCIWKLGMAHKTGSEKKNAEMRAWQNKNGSEHLTPKPDPAFS